MMNLRKSFRNSRTSPPVCLEASCWRDQRCRDQSLGHTPSAFEQGKTIERGFGAARPKWKIPQHATAPQRRLELGPVLGVLFGVFADDVAINCVELDEAARCRWFLGAVEQDAPRRSRAQA